MKTIKIEDFLDQIEDLKTVDYILLHINGSGIQTPIHAAPLEVLEALHSTEWDPELDQPLEKPKRDANRNGWIYARELKTKRQKQPGNALY